MPENPTTTDKYFSFDIFSSFKISWVVRAIRAEKSEGKAKA